MAGNNGFVAGIGKTNVDLLYSGVSRIPQEGEEIYSSDFSMQLGGGIPATMIHLSRLGINSKIVTELGEDYLSSFAKQRFCENGAEPINIYNGKKIPINITTAMITEKDRAFMSYGRQNSITDDMLEKAYKACENAKIVEMQVGEYFPVYEKLKQNGSILVFDCGFDENMSLKTYEKYLKLADYYTPNQKEAMMMTNTDSPEKAAFVLSDYFENVVVKLDKNGCLGLRNGKCFKIKEIEEYRLVDSTGAGDAFLGGFIYGIFHGYDFEDCILLGNITGGHCVTSVGCLSAYTDEKLLLNMYNKYKK